MNVLLLIVFLIILITLFAIYKKLTFAHSHFKMKQLLSAPSMLEDLPSVSVCIPARNEVHAMTQCLERVISSRYPKMEIIVLDDRSTDETSVLIKSFAHAGVRFVEGSPLPDGWLGKNHAQEELLSEASGTYVLFLDVDTQISQNTIGQLVSYALQEKADMISVLPQRSPILRGNTLFSTLRHTWALLLHSVRRPAVASNAWMVKRTALLNDLHGFIDCKLEVQPEVRFAQLFSRNQAYRFLQSTSLLGLWYDKKYSSQVETGIRLLYPFFESRLIPLMFAGLITTFLVLPFIFLAIAPLLGEYGLLWQGVSLGFVLIEFVLYASYLRVVWPKYWIVGVVALPFILIQEVILMAMSFMKYTFGTITWKGRPIKTPI